MTGSSKPFLSIYVVWHPGFKCGKQIAYAIWKHFRRRIFVHVSGGAGINVIYRFSPPSDSEVPVPINLDEANLTGIVVLIDSNLVEDDAWIQYVRDIARLTKVSGLETRIFPIFMESEVSRSLRLAEQALQWENWTGSVEQKLQRLIGKLTYEFCRMARHYLECLRHPAKEEDAFEKILEKVQVFISHSKHNGSGKALACAIRKRIHEDHAMLSFFDVYDIPAGLPFDKVLLQQIKSSAVIAIHTDSYSSREWCRREVIEAKLANVPLVVANCISNLDERSFPYLGNVPNIRLNDEGNERIDFLINRLLDEVLKDFLWQCQIENYSAVAGPGVQFIPRPPELIFLARLPAHVGITNPVIVYPDPPLSKEEKRLFTLVAPGVRLLTIMKWMAEKK